MIVKYIIIYSTNEIYETLININKRNLFGSYNSYRNNQLYTYIYIHTFFSVWVSVHMCMSVRVSQYTLLHLLPSMYV